MSGATGVICRLKQKRHDVGTPARLAESSRQAGSQSGDLRRIAVAQTEAACILTQSHIDTLRVLDEIIGQIANAIQGASGSRRERGQHRRGGGQGRRCLGQARNHGQADRSDPYKQTTFTQANTLACRYTLGADGIRCFACHHVPHTNSLRGRVGTAGVLCPPYRSQHQATPSPRLCRGRNILLTAAPSDVFVQICSVFELGR